MIKALGKDFDKPFKMKDCVFQGEMASRTSTQILQLQRIRFEDVNSRFQNLSSSILDLSYCRVKMTKTRFEGIKSLNSLVTAKNSSNVELKNVHFKSCEIVFSANGGALSIINSRLRMTNSQFEKVKA